MKGDNFNWYGGNVQRAVEANLNRNMKRAVIFLQGQLMIKVSGLSPSAPGNPPGVDTGNLRRNIGWDVSGRRLKLKGRVGTAVGNKQSIGYAVWLEFGTKHMAERPYLRPGLRENLKKLSGIIGARLV